ncbi:ParB N-terminal domain-containing protein [Actinomadura sp. CNU-125]|uniref:ParB N-terminal domain-containing protein n=1 Tax=Actinomadura sp. CNU-125 TaxID=1904961 RepID=UPI0021CD05F6|nr:ParB N-terminal domain-containing protein [Actinomadura sp. CNU-125]
MPLKTELGQVDDLPVVRLELAALTMSESPRRGGIDAEHVEALAAVQEDLPPIIVHRPTMAVLDGRHRVRAAARRGATTIAARLFQGDGDDAFVLAVRANVTHGLPLPMADRKRAAERIVASHPQWSNRMIASVTGMAPGTVADVRRRAGGEPAAVRVGQDGRARPVNGAERRGGASELINDNPDMSLRQVARAVGISPETARDVRNRLRRGEDPLATGVRHRPRRPPRCRWRCARTAPRPSRRGWRRPGRGGAAAADRPGAAAQRDRPQAAHAAQPAHREAGRVGGAHRRRPDALRCRRRAARPRLRAALGRVRGDRRTATPRRVLDRAGAPGERARRGPLTMSSPWDGRGRFPAGRPAAARAAPSGGRRSACGRRG